MSMTNDLVAAFSRLCFAFADGSVKSEHYLEVNMMGDLE